MFLPFKPTKGEAFRLQLDIMGQSNGSTIAIVTDFHYVGLSKDGAQFTETVNTPVFIAVDTDDTGASRSCSYLDLTASEMNADIIVVVARNTTGTPGLLIVITIYTSADGEDGGGSGGGMSLDDIIDGSVTLPRGDLTVRQALELLIQRLGRNNPKI